MMGLNGKLQLRRGVIGSNAELLDASLRIMKLFVAATLPMYQLMKIVLPRRNYKMMKLSCSHSIDLFHIKSRVSSASSLVVYDDGASRIKHDWGEILRYINIHVYCCGLPPYFNIEPLCRYDTFPENALGCVLKEKGYRDERGSRAERVFFALGDY